MTTTREDAEATIKFAILDAISGAYGEPPEQLRDVIYSSITSPEYRWAFALLTLAEAWRVYYSNYFPREVDSTWPTEAEAAARAVALNDEVDAKGLDVYPMAWNVERVI